MTNEPIQVVCKSMKKRKIHQSYIPYQKRYMKISAVKTMYTVFLHKERPAENLHKIYRI